MKIETKDFRNSGDAKIDLQRRPTHVKPCFKSKKHYHKLLDDYVEELSELQRLLYASNRHALLLIFQAMDAAGKDGAIRHVMSGINPQGCQVFSFKQPSTEELEHDFLWRTNRCLPERGRIGIFNRSYYEEVLIVRVHPELLQTQGLPVAAIDRKSIWQERFRSIVDLEAHLHRNGTRVLKFFLHLSKEEQRQRFLARIDEQELEVQPGRRQGAPAVGRVHARLRVMPQCDQHGARAVACRARRRQKERPADHFADHPRSPARP